MFRICKQKNARVARFYYTSPAEYYLGGKQELPGVWGGKGAARLGLDGEVSKLPFDTLCQNRNPATGERLTARDRAGRIVGHDFNFHCPKSLSILYGLTGNPAILAAFLLALELTMAEMEQAMQTRVRKRGQMADRTTGEMIFSRHVHLTARPVNGVSDPHLHAHLFVFNATWDSVEGQWKASKIADIHRDAPYYQAVFHSHLAKAVAGLGLPLEQTAKGWEIAGLTHLVPAFSLRTAEIEAIAAERGITDPAVKDGLGAATRRHKRKDLDMGELQKRWLARLGDGDRRGLAALAASPGSPPPAVSVDQAINTAIGQRFAKGHALVPEKRLVADALSLGLGSLSIEAIRRRLPAHGIVFRDYDGQRFCAMQEQPGRALTPWEHERQAFIRSRQRRACHDQNRATETTQRTAYGR